jgi:Holliday junction resolvase
MVDTRTKGLRGEYAVRDMLRDTTKLAWERTPASGALEHTKGDLYIPNEKQLAVIEVKNYKESSLNDKLLTTKAPDLVKWWNRVKIQASGAKCAPLLFYKYDRSKWFVATEVAPVKLKNYIFVAPLNCYNAVATEWLAMEWEAFYQPLLNKSLDKA